MPAIRQSADMSSARAFRYPALAACIAQDRQPRPDEIDCVARRVIREWLNASGARDEDALRRLGSSFPSWVIPRHLVLVTGTDQWDGLTRVWGEDAPGARDRPVVNGKDAGRDVARTTALILYIIHLAVLRPMSHLPDGRHRSTVRRSTRSIASSAMRSWMRSTSPR